MSKNFTSMSRSVKSLEKILELSRISRSKFITKYEPAAPVGARGTFGGTLMAQSLLASLNTVPLHFIPTSFHCYFVSSGDPKTPITYDVEEMRKGKNFIHTQIKAYQYNKLVFTAMVLYSLQKDSNYDSLHHLKKVRGIDPVPNESKYQDSASLFKENVVDHREKFSKIASRFSDDEHLKKHWHSFEEQPMQYYFPKDFFHSQQKTNLLDYYVKIRSNPIIKEESIQHPTDALITPMNDSRYNYVAFTYLSDSYLLLTLPYFNNLPLFSHKFSVSLDHSIYFHQLPMVNDWIYLQIKNSRSHWDRHLLQGEYFNAESGQIIASVSQEGLVAYDPEGEIRAKL